MTKPLPRRDDMDGEDAVCLDTMSRILWEPKFDLENRIDRDDFEVILLTLVRMGFCKLEPAQDEGE
jgi:hypothetical protein